MSNPSQLAIDPSQLSDTPPVQTAGSPAQNVTSGAIDPSQLSDGPTQNGSQLPSQSGTSDTPSSLIGKLHIVKGGLAEKVIQQFKPEFEGDATEEDVQNEQEQTRQAIGAAVNRFAHVPADIYGAFAHPPTQQEQQYFQNLAQEQGPDAVKALQKNGGPGAASLAYHRLIEQPYEEGTEKATNTANAASQSFKQGEYGKAANQELSALAGQTLSDIPLIGPMINGIAERFENGDQVGAATDLLLLRSLEKSSLSPETKARIVSGATKLQNSTRNLPHTIENALSVDPSVQGLQREPEAVPPVVAPVSIDTSLDDATIRKAMGGKDLSQEARDTLREHAGDTIPRGSSPEVQLLKSVQPVNDAIVTNGTALNDILEGAPDLQTSIFDPRSDANIPDAISQLKENLPGGMEETLSKAIDKETDRASKAIGTTTSPIDLNNYIRELDKRISSYTAPEEPIDSPSSAADATRVIIRRILRDKLNTEIPETQPINDVLSRNIELRSLLRKRLGDIADDPVAADAQYRSEFTKGKNVFHTENWNNYVDKVKAEAQQKVSNNRKALIGTFGGLAVGGVFGHPVLGTLAGGALSKALASALDAKFGEIEPLPKDQFTRGYLVPKGVQPPRVESLPFTDDLTPKQQTILQRFINAAKGLAGDESGELRIPRRLSGSNFHAGLPIEPEVESVPDQQRGLPDGTKIGPSGGGSTGGDIPENERVSATAPEIASPDYAGLNAKLPIPYLEQMLDDAKQHKDTKLVQMLSEEIDLRNQEAKQVISRNVETVRNPGPTKKPLTGLLKAPPVSRIYLDPDAHLAPPSLAGSNAKFSPKLKTDLDVNVPNRKAPVRPDKSVPTQLNFRGELSDLQRNLVDKWLEMAQKATDEKGDAKVNESAENSRAKGQPDYLPTFTQVARELNIAPNTARNAIARLSEQLKDKYGIDPTSHAGMRTLLTELRQEHPISQAIDEAAYVPGTKDKTTPRRPQGPTPREERPNEEGDNDELPLNI